MVAVKVSQYLGLIQYIVHDTKRLSHGVLVVSTLDFIIYLKALAVIITCFAKNNYYLLSYEV